MGLQTKQVQKQGEKSAKPRKANWRVIGILWSLVAVKVFCWQSFYWLAASAELAYIAVALFLLCTRPRANRVNGGLVLAYEAGAFLLNFLLGKFGIRVPHG